MENNKKNNKKNNWSKCADESVIAYLKRILDANWIQVIIAFIGLIFSAVATVATVKSCSNESKEVVVEQKKSECEMLRDSIMSKISIIESTFQPEKIPMNLDSVKERNIILIKDFKVKSIEAATLLRELLNEPKLTEFAHLDAQELYNLDITTAEKKEAVWYSLDAAIKYTLMLDSIGSEHDITGYIINKAVFEKMSLLENQFEEKRNELLKKIDNLLEIMAQKSPTKGDIKTGTKEDLMKMLKYYEEFINDPVILNYLDKTLLFFIHQNKNYNVPLTKYLSGYINV